MEQYNEAIIRQEANTDNHLEYFIWLIKLFIETKQFGFATIKLSNSVRVINSDYLCIFRYSRRRRNLQQLSWWAASYKRC